MPSCRPAPPTILPRPCPIADSTWSRAAATIGFSQASSACSTLQEPRLSVPRPASPEPRNESLPGGAKLATTRAMKSQWNDRTAQEMVETYAAEGVAADIALRVYTTRLLGRDPLLVLHGDRKSTRLNSSHLGI